MHYRHSCTLRACINDNIARHQCSTWRMGRVTSRLAGDTHTNIHVHDVQRSRTVTANNCKFLLIKINVLIELSLCSSPTIKVFSPVQPGSTRFNPVHPGPEFAGSSRYCPRYAKIYLQSHHHGSLRFAPVDTRQHPV